MMKRRLRLFVLQSKVQNEDQVMAMITARPDDFNVSLFNNFWPSWPLKMVGKMLCEIDDTSSAELEKKAIRATCGLFPLSKTAKAFIFHL